MNIIESLYAAGIMSAWILLSFLSAYWIARKFFD